MLDATSFFGHDRVTLYHGSQNVLKRPEFGVGNPHNDYGLAFYTTELPELAFEWACPRADDGWVNEYLIDVRDLNVIDLGSSEFTVLNWMAVLLEHRKVSVGVGIVGEAREFLVANYAVDLSAADLVHGYRADDSYFHIARAFLGNRISVVVGGKVSTGNEAVNTGQTLIDNVSVEYRLDKSATRYVTAFYDKNYENVLDGEVTEMGASLVLRRKTNKLGELFLFRNPDSRKKKKEKE